MLSLNPELQDEFNSNLKKVFTAKLPTALWAHDLTPWAKYDDAAKKSIANRLGWLETPTSFLKHVDELNAFASDVVKDGFKHVAVLGMGGSSLCVEVLSEVFGSQSGYPKLHVLDSTHPDQILSLENAVDLKHTLFVVSSKSGSTLEPNCYFDYFWDRVSTLKLDNIGSRFVAITDEGSDLAKLAGTKKFRKAFINPSDIGGRFSVLSYFGLLPAALIGIDIKKLLERTSAEASLSRLADEKNESVRFGVAMATAAMNGQDKLTILPSPAIKSFGYWAEQLIAESTGKQGTGILPVEGEGRLPDNDYGDDRLFVALNLKGDKEDFAKLPPGPCQTFDLNDRYDMGAQFFRWEFAVAVAGWLLGINPFDEPNVAESKANTNRVLAGDTSSTPEQIEQIFFDGNVKKAVDQLEKFLYAKEKLHSYVAVMAYIERDENSMKALAGLRKRIEEKYHIAVTVGFGPRFLHSTGQFHKGGPNEGVYLQITDIPKHELSIPGKPFSFGKLIAAQAEGDRESLTSKAKPLIQLCLTTKPVEELETLAKAV